MLLDLHCAEETVPDHSMAQKCCLIVAIFSSAAFVPPDECALDHGGFHGGHGGEDLLFFFSGECRFTLREEILLSLPSFVLHL